MLEDIRLDALHELDVVVGELEWSSLEVHVSWWGWKHKAKINVDDMSIYIDKDIVVMSVFDIEIVLDERIPGQTLDEIGQACFPIHSKNLSIDILQTTLMWDLF